MTGKIRILIGTVLLGLVLMAVVLTACGPEKPVARSYQCNVYVEQGCAKFVAASGGEIEIRSGGTLDVQSGSTVGFAASLNGLADVDIGTWLNLSAQSVIAFTNGDTLTPTGTYQIITSTAMVTTSTGTAIANGGETGDLLILRNANAADVIVIDGTGANVECKANVSLGAGDTLTLIWNGADWNCLSNYDNS